MNMDKTNMSSARNTMPAKSLCCYESKTQMCQCVLRDRKRDRICLQGSDKAHFITNQKNNERFV